MKRILLALSGMVVGLGMNAQQINSFPHYTDFELEGQGSTGCHPVTYNVVSPGWSNVTGDQSDWTSDVGGTSSSNTGPSVDFDPGSSTGHYMYVESSCSWNSSDFAHFVSDSINLTGANAMQFEYAYHMFGTSMGNLHIDIDTTANGNWWNDFIPSMTGNVNQWFQNTINLQQFNGQFIKIRIRAQGGTSFGSDMAIDALHIYDLLPDDAGIAWVDSPSTPACNLGNNVWATVYNYGTDTLTSVNVDWDLNAVSQTTATFPTLYVLPGNDTSLFIGTAAITNGDQLKIWTSMPNGVTEFASGAGNDTAWQNVQTGLSGTYSLGGPGANFPSFDSTVQALTAYGVCGPIVFNVYDSVYVEQISIPQIIGMSPFNTVSYIGATDTTTLEWNAASNVANWVLQLNGADYFSFNSLRIRNATPTTYLRCLDIQGGADNNVFDSCIFIQTNFTNTTSTFSTLIWNWNSSLDNSNTFRGNLLQGGSYGMYWWGQNTTTLESNTIISGNHFNDQYYYGIQSYYQDGITMDRNVFESNTPYTSYRPMFLVYNDNGIEITNNIVRTKGQQGTGGFVYGLYMSNCDGTANNMGLIANNMISAEDTVYTGTQYGMYMTNNGFQNVVHNSVCIGNAGTNSRAHYGTGGGGSVLQNNIFANMGPGYANYLNSGFTYTTVDNNNLYAPNGNTGWFSGVQATFANWQSATGFDGSGYGVDPLFYAKNDLHTCADTLNDAGAPTGLVFTDIDTDVRSSTTPDIGADEFFTLTGNFLAADTAICPGDSLQIGLPGATGNFAWSTGDSTSTIWVSNPATYILTASNVCGSGSDNIVITNLPLPVASFTQIVTFYTVQFTSTATNATSWWWDFGDGNTSTQQNPAHLYAWPGGTFNVTHVAYNTCGNDTTVISVTADESTGLADNAFAAGVSIYPNPAVGAFNISMTLNQGETVNVEVVSVTGAVVYSEALVGTQGTNVINVEKELASGSYFVRLRSEYNSAIKKLIIE